LILKHWEAIFQFVKYLTVGGAAALVYFLTLLVAVETFKLPHATAISIAYLSSVIFHFGANKTFTFKNRDTDVLKEAGRFFCVVLINYVITMSVVFVVVDWGGYSTYLGALLGIAATVGLGYLMTKFWVFHHKREPL
jgi:putative flippase GtrA